MDEEEVALDAVFEGIVAVDEDVERMMCIEALWRSLDVLSMLIGPLDGWLEVDVWELNPVGERVIVVVNQRNGLRSSGIFYNFPVWWSQRM